MGPFLKDCFKLEGISRSQISQCVFSVWYSRGEVSDHRALSPCGKPVENYNPHHRKEKNACLLK